jgi:hypothetical protein
MAERSARQADLQGARQEKGFAKWIKQFDVAEAVDVVLILGARMCATSLRQTDSAQ